MILLRGTPSTYASSQPTLLTPYSSGTGTPEEEEDLALLQHLERQQQRDSYQNLPGESLPGGNAGMRTETSTAWGGDSAQADEAPPRHLLDEGAAEHEAWTPGSVPPSMAEARPEWQTPGAAFPLENAPPQHEQGHAPGWWSGVGQAAPGWQQRPQTMAPPATPAVPSATGGRMVDGPPPPRQGQQPEGSTGGAPRPASPGSQTGQLNREDRGGKGGRGLPGLDLLGQPAPAPRQQSPAENKKDDEKLKPYYQVGRGNIPKDANVVVLYNKKSPTVVTPFGDLSNGTTFELHGMAVLNDASGNASENPRMIDISDPGWIHKLDALVQKHGKFAHVFVIDHGTPGSVSFGKHPGAYPEFVGMDKDSAPVSVIGSVLADHGQLHLGTCLTGRGEVGLQYLKGLRRVMDRGNHISIDAITNYMYNRLNAYDGRLIRVP